jgi:VanZ family protein
MPLKSDATGLIFQRMLRITAWAVLVFIAFATLSPLGLRPEMWSDPFYERFTGYAVLGLIFGIAYPRRLLVIASVVLAVAGILEVLQHLTPDRHGHLRDLVAKASGGLFGVAISELINRYLLPFDKQDQRQG